MTLQISIRDEKPAEPAPVMNLFLEQRGDNVFLRGEDAIGRSWTILKIGSDGISRAISIPATTGWPLDAKGALYLTGATF